MNLKRGVITATALSAIPSVFAQDSIALGALGTVGNLFTGIFDAMFSGISQPIWMKVILWIISFTLLYMVFGVSNKDQKPMFNKGSRTLLSIAIALAMIAPLSNSFVESLFGSLGFVGLIFYVAPVIGLMYLTRKMTHETKTDGTTVPSTERHNYVTALIFWLIIWIPYINGVAAGTDINYIGFTSAILNLVAIWYIIYYIFKSVTAGNKEDASTEANSAGTGLNTPVGRAANHVVDFAKDKLEAFRKRHITRISQILNHTLASLARVAEEVEKTDWAYLVANQRKIKHDFEQLTDDLVTLLHERAVDSLIPQRILKDLLHDTFVVQKQANGFADTPFNSTDAAEQKQLIAEMKKWFGRSGAGLQLYPRWQNELKL